MQGFGVYNLDYIVPFAIALFVETYETGHGQFGVRLVLRNDTMDNHLTILTTLIIPGNL